MSGLLDNLRHIGDRWAIEIGQYTSTEPMNQRFLSTTGDQDWVIASGPATAPPALTWLKTSAIRQACAKAMRQFKQNPSQTIATTASFRWLASRIEARLIETGTTV